MSAGMRTKLLLLSAICTALVVTNVATAQYGPACAAPAPGCADPAGYGAGNGPAGYGAAGYGAGGYGPAGYGAGGYGPASCGPGAPACGSCSDCGPSCLENWFDDCCGQSMYGRVEYLMWWSQRRTTPPLVSDGLVDAPGTTVLYGGDYGEGMRSGARVTFGTTIGKSGEFSLNGRVWGLGDSSDNATFTAADSPVLLRPFFNTTLGAEDGLVVATPGLTADESINVRTKNSVLGADAYVRDIFWWDDNFRVDLLAGYQFVRIDDSIFIDSDFTAINPVGPDPVGTRLSFSDSFRTQNEFHGGQIGAVVQRTRGRAWFELLGKVAIGNMRERAILTGQTERTEPLQATTTLPSGVLVQGTNSGTYTQDRFTYIPELNLTVGYQLTPSWSLTAGYSIIYFNNLLEAGNQIDRSVNVSQNPGPIVGPPRPLFTFQDSDFWLQGLNFGAEYRF